MKMADVDVENGSLSEVTVVNGYISCCKEDKDTVTALKKQLAKKNLKCKIIQYQTAEGEEAVKLTSENAIKKTDIVFIAATERFIGEDEFLFRVKQANKLNKPVMVLLLDDSVWPPKGHIKELFTNISFLRTKPQSPSSARITFTSQTLDEIVSKTTEIITVSSSSSTSQKQRKKDSTEKHTNQLTRSVRGNVATVTIVCNYKLYFTSLTGLLTLGKIVLSTALWSLLSTTAYNEYFVYPLAVTLLTWLVTCVLYFMNCCLEIDRMRRRKWRLIYLIDDVFGTVLHTVGIILAGMAYWGSRNTDYEIWVSIMVLYSFLIVLYLIQTAIDVRTLIAGRATRQSKNSKQKKKPKK